MISSIQTNKILVPTISEQLQVEPTINGEQFQALINFFTEIKQAHKREQIVFMCIGTDRSTGDSFGPLLGSWLKTQGFANVYGTLDEPCDADHVYKVIEQLQATQKTVIAVDACLGKPSTVGSFILNNGPLVPGAGVGRTLPPVGDYSIAAVVNKKGLKSYWQLQHTSLFFVYRMVNTLLCAINKVWDEGDNI